jgi:hypothetical protein
MLKKGDRVLVWSLQSFSNGGFLQGEPAFLRQSQNGDSVILCVIRNFGGENKIDESYEVYREQVVKVTKNNWDAQKRLKQFRKEILSNGSIS